MADQATPGALKAPGSLRDFRIPQEPVELSDGTIITVRGVSLNDLGRLLLERQEDMSTIYNGLMIGEIEAADRLSAVYAVMAVCPILVAKIIATAANEPDLWEAVLNFPAGDQAKLGEKILEVTFRSGTDLGNVARVVEETARKAAARQATKGQPSTNGSSVFGKKRAS